MIIQSSPSPKLLNVNCLPPTEAVILFVPLNFRIEKAIPLSEFILYSLLLPFVNSMPGISFSVILTKFSVSTNTVTGAFTVYLNETESVEDCADALYTSAPLLFLATIFVAL